MTKLMPHPKETFKYLLNMKKKRITKTPRKQTVEIEIDLLRRIAALRKKAEAFDKIAEIVEDYKHENK